jgi:two-component system phosphate regulon sensor histidine kinase PhoR
MSSLLYILSAIVVAVLLFRLNQQRQQISKLKSQSYRLHRLFGDIQAENETYRSMRDGLFVVMQDALLALDAAGTIIFSNKVADELFQRSCVGETLMVATRDYELDALAQNAAEHPHDLREQRLTINQRILQVRVLNIEVYTLILLQDVTVMQQLSRARREMIANISHELNTPITTIGLLADTLLNGASEKADIRDKMLQNIRAEADMLHQLVQEMRDLSLIESRQMPIKMVETSLLPLIQSSVEPLFSLAERKSHTITVDIPDHLVVLADVNQIPRVVRNVVHNAIKFTPDGGQIDIRAGFDAEGVTVMIRDNGPGIRPQDLSRIFERFFQGDQSRQQGTGLGLAIARHIVIGHGGEIHVENNPDQGSTFYFSLPRGRVATRAADDIEQAN